MLPINGRPLGPGGSGNVWFACPRVFDLARSQANEAARMQAMTRSAAMIIERHADEKIGLGQVCLEHEEDTSFFYV